MPYVKVDPKPLDRNLSDVAADILHDYQGLPSFQYAKPYVLELLACHTTDLCHKPGKAGEQECGELVRHLLLGLRHWKGTLSKKVKLELRQALAHHDQEHEE